MDTQQRDSSIGVKEKSSTNVDKQTNVEGDATANQSPNMKAKRPDLKDAAGGAAVNSFGNQ